MKAEAEQTNSISSGWKRELLHYNMREDLPEKTPFLLGKFCKFCQKQPSRIVDKVAIFLLPDLVIDQIVAKFVTKLDDSLSLLVH